MTIQSAYTLINNIEGYYRDILNADGRLPFGKNGAKLRAVWSFLVWGTSFSEYFGYRFWQRSFSEKRAYMTRRHMFRFFDRYNPPELRERIGDKRQSKQYYGELMQREQFDFNRGKAAFFDYCRRYPRLFIKRAVGWGGEGAYAADASDEGKMESVWAELDGDCVIEPQLENCPELKALHPGSLNTIKVTTLMLSGGAEIQTALFRCGNNTPVDNVHLGGMCALVDLDSGTVKDEAVDNHFCRYSVHPVTGLPIQGVCIPYWAEVKQLALKAAAITPELRYCSWDIAVLENGPVLIEGNWDAEFYAEQTLACAGERLKYQQKLDGVWKA